MSLKLTLVVAVAMYCLALTPPSGALPQPGIAVYNYNIIACIIIPIIYISLLIMLLATIVANNMSVTY